MSKMPPPKVHRCSTSACSFGECSGKDWRNDEGDGIRWFVAGMDFYEVGKRVEAEGWVEYG